MAHSIEIRDVHVLVDEQFIPALSKYHWTLSPGGYAWAKKPGGGMVMMHRLIWALAKRPDCQSIDHINRNRLDNRLDNLRAATHTQNGANKGLLPTNTSGYKGVYWDEPHGFWRAQIRKRGKFYHLGYFEIPEDAAYAYNKKARQLYREFAVLNELPSDYSPNPRKPRKSPRK